MKRYGWRPRRSIKFAFWGAGEYGSIGFQFYAKIMAIKLDRFVVVKKTGKLNSYASPC